MIQRIQTLYLFVALGLLIATFFMPVAELNNQNGNVFSLSFYHWNKDVGEVTFLFLRIIQTLLIGISIMLLVTIFLYKKRATQMKFCLYMMISVVILSCLMAYVIIATKNSWNGILSYKITEVFPLLSTILMYMANRSIKKDEELVRSLDRVR
jgi:hypothetical protein